MYINVTWNCRVCVEVAFLRLLSAVRMLAKPYHFRVNWPTTLCENNDGCISLPSNKLLLRNSGYDDIAWCNKNNSELGFCGFFLKNNKNLFLSKKRNKKKQVSCYTRNCLYQTTFRKPHYTDLGIYVFVRSSTVVLNLGFANPQGFMGRFPGALGWQLIFHVGCCYFLISHTRGKCVQIENSAQILHLRRFCQLTGGSGWLFYDSGVLNGKKVEIPVNRFMQHKGPKMNLQQKGERDQKLTLLIFSSSIKQP